MGAYVYKLSTRNFVDAGGKRVYLATYAYKPYWFGDGVRHNNRMHFQTGCTATDAAFRRKGIKPEYWCYSEDDGSPSRDHDGKIGVYRVDPYSPGTTTDDGSDFVGRVEL